MMTDDNSLDIGKVGWIDLTVPDADKVRDFYEQVVGWKSTPVSMGDYDDFNMTPPHSEQPAAGICHRRGVNSEIPSQWMIYIIVANLDESVDRCLALGGEVLVKPRDAGNGARLCVIRDPAGAVAALYQK